MTSTLRPFTADQIRELLATSRVPLPVAQYDQVVEAERRQSRSWPSSWQPTTRSRAPTPRPCGTRSWGPSRSCRTTLGSRCTSPQCSGSPSSTRSWRYAIESAGGEVATTLRLLTAAWAARRGGRTLRLPSRDPARERHVARCCTASGPRRTGPPCKGFGAHAGTGRLPGLAQLAHHLVAAGEYVAAASDGRWLRPAMPAASMRFAEATPPAGRGTRGALEPGRRPGAAQRADRRRPGPSRGRDGALGGPPIGSGRSSSGTVLATVPPVGL